MSGASLSALEMAVLQDISRQMPANDRAALEKQLDGISVLSRENTGAGFFTSFAVKAATPPILVDTKRYEVHATFPGRILRLGFILWLNNRIVEQLEGYSLIPEDTTELDLCTLKFELISFE
jgi:hypothetical protein